MTSLITQQERDLLTAALTVEKNDRSFEPESNRLDCLSAPELRAIKILHQRVAGRFSHSLSNLLQRIVDVRITDVVSQTYSQFAFSRSNPTCLVTLSASPLPEPLCIDLSPTFLYPMIDCLLGGGREPISLPDRPPTEIEKRFGRRIVEVLMDELHEAWEPVLAVELEIQTMNHAAQQVRMVAPSESVISLCFRVRVADQNGEFTLCLPLKAIEKMITRLSVEPISTSHSPIGSFQQSDGRQSGVDEVSVRVVMGALELDDDFESMQPGDLIKTEICPDSQVSVFVDGTERFLGRPGCVNGKKAVVIERISMEF